MPDLPLTVLHDLIVAGEDLGVDAGAFERIVLDAADAHRSGGTWRVVRHDDPVPVQRDDLTAGNGFVRFGFDPATTPWGRPWRRWPASGGRGRRPTWAARTGRSAPLRTSADALLLIRGS